MSQSFSCPFQLKRFVISIAIWFSTFWLTVLLYLVMLAVTGLVFSFDKNRKIQHLLCFWWSDAVILLNPYWRVRVRGIENIEHAQTYVIVANHQSMADIALLFQTRMQFKWIAKNSLFRFPILGWCMTLARHVRLKRENFSSIKQALRQAEGWLDSGVSVIFFPEGTRSRTGEMNIFRNGAFKLAVKKQVPILPIAIDGTACAVPKGKWLFNPTGTITMTILPKLDPKNTTYQDVESIKLTAWERIKSCLGHHPRQL